MEPATRETAEELLRQVAEGQTASKDERKEREASDKRAPYFAATSVLEELCMHDAWRRYCPVAFTRFEPHEKRLRCAVCAVDVKM